VVGYPSPKYCENMVGSKMIKNSPTDVQKLNKNNLDVTTLKWKTTIRTNHSILTEYVEIPKEIMDLNKNMMISADVMFVDDLRFMITASRKIKLTTSVSQGDINKYSLSH
jgi:hypothetical protein